MPIGLAVRMAGENPMANEAQGINVLAVRTGAVMVETKTLGESRPITMALPGRGFSRRTAKRSFSPTASWPDRQPRRFYRVVWS